MNKKKIVGISAPNSTLAKKFLNNKDIFKIKIYKGSINNKNNFIKWVNQNKDLNAFVNFGAIVSVAKGQKNKKKTLQTNYKSVVNMMKIFKQSKLDNFKYFLAISSSHVFNKSNYKLNENNKKKPDNFYGFSKIKMENYILNNNKKFNFNIGIARIFNYFDKKSTKSFFINDIKKKLDNCKKVLFFGVNTKRDFIHINDINSAIIHMIKLRLIGDFNICTGKGISLKNIIIYLNKKMNNKNIVFDNVRTKSLVGSNLKLKKTGWKTKHKININYFA